MRDDVEVVHRSYPMSPSLPTGDGLPQREVLRQVGKVGRAAEDYIRPIERLAERDGLRPYVVMDNRLGNTAHVHELLAYATGKGMNAEAWHRAFRAHFGQARSLFDVDSVVALGRELGFDGADVREALVSGKYRQQVRRDHAEALQLGSRGVPFTVIDQRYALTGAQEIQTYLQVVERAWNETHRPAAPQQVCVPWLGPGRPHTRPDRGPGGRGKPAPGPPGRGAEGTAHTAGGRVLTAAAVNRPYVGDITYLPLNGGKFLYPATIIDLSSRRPAGRALAESFNTTCKRETLQGRTTPPDRTRRPPL
ncbi:DsbA family protein [Streptomyces scopuliridis]|uniref:DsbA family oxidoreductase n=1 Tax=Streptomyces scopuliridis TaxID=452529 RepID=UPI0036C64777